MTSLSLDNLSTETLCLICSHFCLHCRGVYQHSWDDLPLQYHQNQEAPKVHETSQYSLDRQSLCSLSLVSKRLRDIAQNVLYHEFALGFSDYWGTNAAAWDGRLMCFLRTVVARPDLATLVKAVHIHPCLLNLDRVDLDEARSLLIKAASSLGIDLPEAWRQRIPSLHLDTFRHRQRSFESFLASFLDGNDMLAKEAQQKLKKQLTEGGQYARRWLAAELVAMLIAHLPNLAYLGLDDDDRWPDSGFPGSALTALKVSQLQLKTLHLGLVAEPLVQLAKDLSTLCLCGPGLESSFPPQSLPNLKALRVSEANLRDGTLQDLLSACTGGLHTFVYEAAKYQPLWGFWESDTPPPNYHFRPAGAVKSLGIHQNTLRSLHLDLGAQDYRAGVIPPELTFKGFKVLQNLFLHSPEMFDPHAPELEHLSDSRRLAKLIPTSLISLSVHVHPNCDSKRLENGLIGLADLKKYDPTEFPNLRWVSSNVKSKPNMLSGKFSAVNVDFDGDVWKVSRVKPYLDSPRFGGMPPLPESMSDDDL
ncbi:Fc.00g023650.m01.CDS01 [Cosmosporella sp. VM-42]